MAALQIAFAVISVAVVVVIAYFLHTCSREATPIPARWPMPAQHRGRCRRPQRAAATLSWGWNEAAISALPRVGGARRGTRPRRKRPARCASGITTGETCSVCFPAATTPSTGRASTSGSASVPAAPSAARRRRPQPPRRHAKPRLVLRNSGV
ncbi:hypothetical protein ACQ4PT_068442 [Festuca glaucescens]